MKDNPAGKSGESGSTRWIQLGAAIFCMVAIANLQYAWALFVPEIEQTHNWSRASIQVTFAIFVAAQTWLTPLEGIVLDKYGPRIMVLFGGVLVSLCWILNSQATSLSMFYYSAVIGGIGVGSVYVTAANVAVRWFADRRGLAAGLVGAGYGAGSALTLIPIANIIHADGYQAAFLTFGLILGPLLIVASFILRSPRPGEVQLAVLPKQSRRDYTTLEAIRTPLFYVMLAILILVTSGGLMAVAQLGIIAKDLGVKDTRVDLGFFAMAALPFALMLDRVCNGIARPLFGSLSDYVGRENTMFIAFTIEGLGIVALGVFGRDPWAFLIMSAVVFLAWGEIYSLFSAVAADAYGTKNYGKIYGLLYCGKGVSALLVPIGNLVADNTGSWTAVIALVAAMNFVAAFLALLVLKPMLTRHCADIYVAPDPLPSAGSRLTQPKQARVISVGERG